MDTRSIVLVAVCRRFGQHPGALLSRSRRAPVAIARQTAMFILRQEAGWSFPRIARALHRSDHTTAMHACALVADRVRIDPDLRQQVEAARAEAAQRLRAYRTPPANGGHAQEVRA